MLVKMIELSPSPPPLPEADGPADEGSLQNGSSQCSIGEHFQVTRRKHAQISTMRVLR